MESSGLCPCSSGFVIYAMLLAMLCYLFPFSAMQIMLCMRVHHYIYVSSTLCGWCVRCVPVCVCVCMTAECACMCLRMHVCVSVCVYAMLAYVAISVANGFVPTNHISTHHLQHFLLFNLFILCQTSQHRTLCGTQLPYNIIR